MNVARFRMVCAALVVSIAAMVAPAYAADKTNLVVLVASVSQDSFPEIAAAYTKTHPSVAILPTYVGSTVIVNSVKQGAAADVILISSLALDDAVKPLVESPTQVFKLRSVLAVAKPSASRISSLKDLAKPGVHFGAGVTGSALWLWQHTLVEKIDAAYGKDFATKFASNTTTTVTDMAHIVRDIDSGTIDSAFVFTSDIKPATMVKIELPADWQVAVPFVAAPVKASTHSDVAKDFAAFMTGPQAVAVFHAHGQETK